MKLRGKSGHSLFVAGALAAVAASICCGAPLVLLALGVGGAWTGFSTALDPYRPVSAGATLLMLSFGFYRLYLAPQACEPGCPSSSNKLKRQRLAFWVAATLAVSLIVGSWWFAPRC